MIAASGTFFFLHGNRMNNLLINHHIYVPGKVPSIANVTVITVINTLSANGSIIVPNSVFILYFLAI